MLLTSWQGAGYKAQPFTLERPGNWGWCFPASRTRARLLLELGIGAVARLPGVGVYPTQRREEAVQHAAFLDGLFHHEPVLAQLPGRRQVGTCGGHLIQDAQLRDEFLYL